MSSLLDEMGRNDPDLTPAHDKAMLWMEQRLHAVGIEYIINRWHPETPPALKHFHTCTDRKRFTETDLALVTSKFPVLERGRLGKLIWEYPLEHGLFLDFVIKIVQACPMPTGPTADGALNGWTLRDRTFLYGFEVKPKNWSIGQTLRQLKTYQRNFDGWLCLIAPGNEDLHRIVKAAGFGFWALGLEP